MTPQGEALLLRMVQALIEVSSMSDEDKLFWQQKVAWYRVWMEEQGRDEWVPRPDPRPGPATAGEPGLAESEEEQGERLRLLISLRIRPGEEIAPVSREIVNHAVSLSLEAAVSADDQLRAIARTLRKAKDKT